VIALSLKVELILFYVFFSDPGEMPFNFTVQAELTRRRLCFHLRFAASTRHDAEARRIIQDSFILITSWMEVIKSNPLSAEKL